VDVKEQLMTQALRLMQDPRVSKALQNPRVMQGLMGAIQLRAAVQENINARVRRVAKGLNLATEAELRELRHKVRRLERELEASQAGRRPEPSGD